MALKDLDPKVLISMNICDELCQFLMKDLVLTDRQTWRRLYMLPKKFSGRIKINKIFLKIHEGIWIGTLHSGIHECGALQFIPSCIFQKATHECINLINNIFNVWSLMVSLFRSVHENNGWIWLNYTMNHSIKWVCHFAQNFSANLEAIKYPPSQSIDEVKIVL